MPGQPKHTRTVSVAVTVDPGDIVVNPIVTWNPSASDLEYEAKDWNRGFELGALTEWTALDAVISEVEPYEGDYCCKLEGDGSKITQTFDTPFPVNGIWTFRFKARSAVGDALVKPIINYLDGTSSEGGAVVRADEWTEVDMLRRDLSAGKIVSGMAIESELGELYIDAVSLVMATDIVTGAVEVSQATADNLQATVTPEATAVFPVVQDTAEDLQVTVTPAADTEFEAVQPTAEDLQAEATPKPKGGVIAKDSDTTAAAYATIGSHTPAAGVSFQLAKILVSCPEDIMYKIRWNGTDISAEVYVTGGIPFTDWFPWDYYDMPGDAAKIFDIQVKYPTDGAAATCHVEIVGEDVGA